jgi:hypothetical protein
MIRLLPRLQPIPDNWTEYDVWSANRSCDDYSMQGVREARMVVFEFDERYILRRWDRWPLCEG